MISDICVKCGSKKTAYVYPHGTFRICLPCQRIYARARAAKLAASGVKGHSGRSIAAKQKAQNAVQNAVKYGKLIRLPCSVCGDQKSEGHHEDYSKPLEVVWLCRTHHAARHIEINDAKRASASAQIVGSAPTPSLGEAARHPRSNIVSSPILPGENLAAGLALIGEPGGTFLLPELSRSSSSRSSQSEENCQSVDL